MALKPQQLAPELLTKVTKALGITALDQWYYVSHYTASKAIGARALNKFGGSVASFLKHAYPQHQFDEEKLISKNHREKDQKFVEVIVRQLFPNTEIHTKARKSVGIVNPETEEYLEIDFWIPSLKLGIEYQDKHHYGYQWYANDTLENYQKRDEIKKDIMSKLGYTLITIGYWWDKNIESLAATIRTFRPELLHDYERNPALPIPVDPPDGFITSTPTIPGVAGIMSPFVPKYKFNPTNWYGGEKHDGIRGVYNPNLKKMFSRSGNVLSVLPALLKDIPSMLVEGEVTAGRGNYNKTSAVSYHAQYSKVNWPLFRYIIFDIPDAKLGTFTQRYSSISSGLLAHYFLFAQPEFRVLLVNRAHLKMLVGSIINDGGEGVIAQLDSTYEYGRAKGLAKIKVRRDADAQVLHINKHSCTCKLVSGVTAEITFSDDFDPRNLEVGDVISYYHNGYSQNGVPKRGEIYKARYDITWTQLITDNSQNIAKRRAVKDAIGSRSLIARDSIKIQMERGHWNKPSRVRAYFDEFARKAGFDPYVVENWYPIRIITLRNNSGGGLLKAYGYSVKSALEIAYPELNFESEKFIIRTKVKHGHWDKIENTRAFFDEFALAAGYDPLVVNNWYRVGIGALQSAGGGGLLGAHGRHLQSALSFAYPELNFDKEKFGTHAIKGRWSKSENVRAYFNDFARAARFDPLVTANWNSLRPSMLQLANGSGLLKAHSFSLKKALSHAYPELQFEE